MNSSLSFLDGGGEMGERIRHFDWQATSLGSPEQWPASLRTTLRILLTTNHPVFVFWGAEHICFYNDAYSRSLGPEKHPSILGARGRCAWDEIWTIIGPQIEQVLAGRGATWHENQLVPITRHGRLQEVYWTYSYGPIDDEHAPNGVGGVLVLCSETTEQVLAEQRLREAERRWRALFDHSPGFICVLAGPEHRFEYANQKYIELVGNRPLIGRTVVEALPEVREQGFASLLDQVFQTGEPFRANAAPVTLARSAAGQVENRFVDFVFQPMRDANGTIFGICVEGLDVTSHVRAEAELSASREQFRVMADGVPGIIWVTNAAGEVEFVNREYREFFGVSETQLRQQGWQPLVHPDDAAAYISRYMRSLAEQSPFHARARVRHASGEWRWVASSGVPRFAENRQFLGHVGISPDITELVSTQEALRRADRVKDEFLATLAHELRSPLAPIRNAAQIIHSPSVAQSAREWSIRVIERQVQNMAWLLDDLLDMSRVTRGMLTLSRQRVSLASLVEAAIEVAQPLIEARRHSLRTLLPPQQIELDVDPVRLSQVLSNLLTNAAKYTDSGGTIELSAFVESGFVLIQIADSGIGLAPDELASVFEMFSQVSSGVDRSGGGLGIGLALVKGLVELHGGEVEALSDGPGLGSRFVVKLPWHPAFEPHREVQAESESRARVSPRRILVADDNGDTAQSMSVLLQLSGHDVRVATDGAEALMIATEFRPDIAFLDIGMPSLSGYEVARALRAQSWGQRIRLIALTGWGQDADRRNALEAGFDQHLTKPVDTDVLESCLSKLTFD